MSRIAIFIFFGLHILPATIAYLIFPSINLFSGYMYIWILFSSFCLGVIISKYKFSSFTPEAILKKKENRNKTNSLICILISIIFLSRFNEILELIYAILNGNIVELAVSNAIERYTAPYNVSYSNFYRIGTAFLFTFSFVLGAFYKNNWVNNLYLLILSFFIFFELAWTLGRQGAFFSIIAFIVSFIVQNRALIVNINLLRMLKYSFIFVFVLVSIWGIVQFGRVSESQNNPIVIVFERFSRYTVTPYAVFMNWANEWDQSLHYGSKTFAGLADFLGIEVVQGFYPRYYVDNLNFSNIFTIYRSLLQDFGILVSSIIFVIFGYIINAYQFLKDNFFTDIVAKIALMLIFFPLNSMLYSSTLFVGFILSSLLIISLNNNNI